MSLRYLVGPVTPARAPAPLASPPRGGPLSPPSTPNAGARPVVLAPADTWETLLARAPRRLAARFRRPRVELLDGSSMPLEDAPVPLVVLVARLAAPVALSTPLPPALSRPSSPTGTGVEVMLRHGITHAPGRPTCSACKTIFTTTRAGVARRRTYRCPLCRQPSTRRATLASTLARPAGALARAGGTVHIAQGVHGEDYRQPLATAARASCSNRSIRGEWNLRVCEENRLPAATLVFNESDNLELPDVWKHREDCVFYDEDNLEGTPGTPPHSRRRACRHRRGRTDQGRALHLRGRMVHGSSPRSSQSWPLIPAAPHMDRPRHDAHAILTARTWQALGAADGGDRVLPVGVPKRLPRARRSPEARARRENGRRAESMWGYRVAIAGRCFGQDSSGSRAMKPTRSCSSTAMHQSDCVGRGSSHLGGAGPPRSSGLPASSALSALRWRTPDARSPSARAPVVPRRATALGLVATSSACSCSRVK